MRGVFDEQQTETLGQSRYTELTLGTGMLFVLFGGLVLLCLLCFGMGYMVGHRRPASSSASAPQSATDQEPLQASGAIPKPSAVLQTPVPAPEPAADATDSAATPDKTAAVSGAIAQPEVHPALNSGSTPQTPPAAPTTAVRPALQMPQPQPQGQQFMVQIAAVSNAQDAEVLVNALRNRGYSVMSHREPGDNLIHVRIGPFASRPLADQWRMKLLNDGYNAEVQP